MSLMGLMFLVVHTDTKNSDKSQLSSLQQRLFLDSWCWPYYCTRICSTKPAWLGQLSPLSCCWNGTWWYSVPTFSQSCGLDQPRKPMQPTLCTWSWLWKRLEWSHCRCMLQWTQYSIFNEPILWCQNLKVESHRLWFNRQSAITLI